MKKPRENNAQSVIEFIVLFVVTAVASVLLLGKIANSDGTGIFNKYVDRCTKCITEGKCTPGEYTAADKT